MTTPPICFGNHYQIFIEFGEEKSNFGCVNCYYRGECGDACGGKEGEHHQLGYMRK